MFTLLHLLRHGSKPDFSEPGYMRSLAKGDSSLNRRLFRPPELPTPQQRIGELGFATEFRVKDRQQR